MFLKAEILSYTMEENCMIQVVGELESDTETTFKTNNKRTVINKHAACQTASSVTSGVLVPIMFCTLFSPICEASVQVNLPLCSASDAKEPPVVASSQDRESEGQPLYHLIPVKKRKKCSMGQTNRKERHHIDFALHDCQEPEDDMFLSLPPAGGKDFSLFLVSL